MEEMGVGLTTSDVANGYKTGYKGVKRVQASKHVIYSTRRGMVRVIRDWFRNGMGIHEE